MELYKTARPRGILNPLLLLLLLREEEEEDFERVLNGRSSSVDEL
jgi:hypothetical protein